MKFDSTAFEAITPQCRGKVSYERVMESTNDLARSEIIAGRASSGSIYLTEYQTGGRGRGGNRWMCPEGEGLLFSIVVDPDVEQALWYRMSLAVGLAIVESIKDLGLDAEVEMKWPNDIYINDKKLGGILIEKVNELLIVGVGINVDVKIFPEEVAERATSISAFMTKQGGVNREQLLSEIVHSIYRNGSRIGAGFDDLIAQVTSCFYLMKKTVSMQVNGNTVEGEVQGMSENGYLLLKQTGKEGGIVEIHHAQEINILKKS